MTPLFTATIPVQVVSEANQREHWGARNKRKKGQQDVTMLMLQSKFPNGKHLRPIKQINLVRVIANKGRVMDTDNLFGSVKHVVDALARWLDLDDRHFPIQVTQRRGITSAVEVEIY